LMVVVAPPAESERRTRKPVSLEALSDHAMVMLLWKTRVTARL
jgi:hypothetical protein